MMKFLRAAAAGLFFLLILIPSVALAKKTEGKLEPYIEIELKRIEETWHLLDTYGKKVWPGWNNHLAIQFKVQFPNLVFMIVNPQGKVPEGYEIVPGRTVKGKHVYLNRKEQLPGILEPPLYGGGQGDTEIRIHLQEHDWRGMPKPSTKAEMEQIREGMASENQILLYIHEYFHTFQEHAWKGWEKNQGEKRFAVNKEYAALSEIEGLALAAAYKEKDNRKAKEFLKDYIVARDLKHTFMTPGAVQREVYTNFEEGLAVYAETRMAQMIRDRKYKPVITENDDPYFANYKFLDQYIAQKTLGEIDYVSKMTLDNGLKYYTYGALEAYLLDRFSPRWKKGFFKKEIDLDERVRKCLKLSKTERKAVVERLKTNYPYDEIFARHGAVIKERDDAIALVTNLKGKKFIVNWKSTKEFFILMPQGKSVIMGVKTIFHEGFQPFTLGEVEMTSPKVLINKPDIWFLEWVDQNPVPGAKGYELTYKTKDGDIYKKAVVKTGGFELKAPELKIEEKDGEVKFIILSKVSR